MSGKTHHCHTPQPHTLPLFNRTHIHTKCEASFSTAARADIQTPSSILLMHCLQKSLLQWIPTFTSERTLQAASRAEQLPTASQSQTLAFRSSWFTHARLVNVGFIIVSSFTMLCCPSSYGLVTEVLHRTVSMSMLSCLITTQS